MKQPKLMTSNAHNDAAVGAFVGFLSTLFFLFGASSLAERLQPSSSTAAPNLVLTLLLPALLVAIVTGIAFVWLRQRLPDFARGYRLGALIIAGIFGVLFLRAIFVWLP